MPIYHYKCSSCPEEFEVYHSIKEDIRKKCPNCFEDTLSVVIDTLPYISMKGEIKTIGQLAEANAKKLGKELVRKKMEEDGTLAKMQADEKRAKINKLASLSDEKKVKYIETGKL